MLSIFFYCESVIPYLYGYRSRIFGTAFFNNQLRLTMHMVGGIFALLLGPLQFWPAFRNRYLKFHRLAGKLYMFGVLLIGISAGRLSLVSTCVPFRISLFLLTVFAVTATWFAWVAKNNRNTKAHRQMMVRSFVCVLAFVLVASMLANHSTSFSVQSLILLSIV